MEVNYKGRELSEDKINWIQTEAQTGDVLEGTVKNIKPFGAFFCCEDKNTIREI